MTRPTPDTRSKPRPRRRAHAWRPLEALESRLLLSPLVEAHSSLTVAQIDAQTSEAGIDAQTSEAGIQGIDGESIQPARIDAQTSEAGIDAQTSEAGLWNAVMVRLQLG